MISHRKSFYIIKPFRLVLYGDDLKSAINIFINDNINSELNDLVIKDQNEECKLVKIVYSKKPIEIEIINIQNVQDESRNNVIQILLNII